MNQKGTTKDELFLLKLHEMALKQGDSETEIDRFAIGRAIGLHDRAIDNIVRHLAQANFIKKATDAAIILTPHGLNLVHQLIEERK
jgi:hypothetical protein